MFLSYHRSLVISTETDRFNGCTSILCPSVPVYSVSQCPSLLCVPVSQCAVPVMECPTGLLPVSQESGSPGTPSRQAVWPVLTQCQCQSSSLCASPPHYVPVLTQCQCQSSSLCASLASLVLLTPSVPVSRKLFVSLHCIKYVVSKCYMIICIHYLVLT